MCKCHEMSHLIYAPDCALGCFWKHFIEKFLDRIMAVLRTNALVSSCKLCA